jgi:hypothetical protein
MLFDRLDLKRQGETPSNDTSYEDVAGDMGEIQDKRMEGFIVADYIRKIYETRPYEINRVIPTGSRMQ